MQASATTARRSLKRYPEDEDMQDDEIRALARDFAASQNDKALGERLIAAHARLGNTRITHPHIGARRRLISRELLRLTAKDYGRLEAAWLTVLVEYEEGGRSPFGGREKPRGYVISCNVEESEHEPDGDYRATVIRIAAGVGVPDVNIKLAKRFSQKTLDTIDVPADAVATMKARTLEALKVRDVKDEKKKLCATGDCKDPECHDCHPRIDCNRHGGCQAARRAALSPTGAQE